MYLVVIESFPVSILQLFQALYIFLFLSPFIDLREPIEKLSPETRRPQTRHEISTHLRSIRDRF